MSTTSGTFGRLILTSCPFLCSMNNMFSVNSQISLHCLRITEPLKTSFSLEACYKEIQTNIKLSSHFFSFSAQRYMYHLGTYNDKFSCLHPKPEILVFSHCAIFRQNKMLQSERMRGHEAKKKRFVHACSACWTLSGWDNW